MPNTWTNYLTTHTKKEEERRKLLNLVGDYDESVSYEDMSAEQQDRRVLSATIVRTPIQVLYASIICCWDSFEITRAGRRS